jgi:hypothetical protein
MELENVVEERPGHIEAMVADVEAEFLRGGDAHALRGEADACIVVGRRPAHQVTPRLTPRGPGCC